MLFEGIPQGLVPCFSQQIDMDWCVFKINFFKDWCVCVYNNDVITNIIKSIVHSPVGKLV